MKVLVTGANGFIGRYVVRDLVKKGHDVVAFVVPKSDISSINEYDIEIKEGLMENYESVANAVEGVECVIHLAALLSKTSKMMEVNVGGAKNIVKAMKEKDVKKVIVISSVSATRPQRDTYGESKLKADEVFLESGLGVVLIRPTLVYGKDSHLFNKIVGYVKNFPVVPIVGHGNYKRQPVYVEDVSSAIVKVYEKGVYNKIYEIGGKDVISFNSLIDMVMKVLNVKKKKFYVPLFGCKVLTSFLSVLGDKSPLNKDFFYGLSQDTTVDISLLVSDIGYNPIELEEGLRKVLN